MKPQRFEITDLESQEGKREAILVYSIEKGFLYKKKKVNVSIDVITY